MIVQLTSVATLAPQELAKALLQATPQQVKAFWLEYASLIEKCDDPDILDDVAKLMAERLGAACQMPLRELLRLIDFHAEAKKRPPHAAGDAQR